METRILIVDNDMNSADALEFEVLGDVGSRGGDDLGVSLGAVGGCAGDLAIHAASPAAS